MLRPLKLPSRPARVRAESKALWNEARSVKQADFFTVGYEGRSIEDLISALRAADIRLLLDIRHSPVSMYRPEVPRAVRAQSIEAGSREPIWAWYDENVIGPFFARNLHRFLNLEHP
jgi:hypothetical protein